ncbi:MAG TPA: histidine kinase [Spirochaetota bacterium]|nr:histidine kinase [Spirochaetota bacterium]
MTLNEKTQPSKGLERLLTTLALESINIPIHGIDDHLNKLLMHIGKYTKADHCYILTPSEDRSELIFSHSWCRRGYVPTLDSIRNSDISLYWNIKKKEVIFVPDVFSLKYHPDSDIKARLNPRLRSAIVAPLILNDVLQGFLGCSLTSRMTFLPGELQSVLRISAELVANLYEKKRIYSQVFIAESIVAKSNNILAYFDGSGKIQYANTAFRENFTGPDLYTSGTDFYSIFSNIADSSDSKLNKKFNAALSGKDSQIEVWIKNRSNLSLYEISLHSNNSEYGNTPGVIFNGRDITDRVQLEAGILKAISQERKRIGILLHDDLGHDLLAADIRLKLLSDRIHDVAPETSEELVEIEKSVKYMMNDVRRLSHGLIPFKNQGLDLREMLDAASIMMSKYYGLQCSYTIHHDVNITSEAVISELFNIITESSVNAVKHSGCDSISIDLSPENNLYVMKITDNGQGIQEKKLRFPGAGLEIMRYRARSIGGLLEIKGSRNHGTTVKVSFNPERINL